MEMLTRVLCGLDEASKDKETCLRHFFLMQSFFFRSAATIWPVFTLNHPFIHSLLGKKQYFVAGVFSLEIDIFGTDLRTEKGTDNSQCR
jgi:hypothetical protein